MLLVPGFHRPPPPPQEKTGLAYLHSSHCLGSGEIVISAMGDPQVSAGCGARRPGLLLLSGADQGLLLISGVRR